MESTHAVIHFQLDGLPKKILAPACGVLKLPGMVSQTGGKLQSVSQSGSRRGAAGGFISETFHPEIFGTPDGRGPQPSHLIIYCDDCTKGRHFHESFLYNLVISGLQGVVVSCKPFQNFIQNVAAHLETA